MADNGLANSKSQRHRKQHKSKLNSILETIQEHFKIENCKKDFCSCFNCCKCSKYKNICMHGKCASCGSCYCYINPPCQQAGSDGKTIQLSPTVNTGPTVITGPNKQISPSLDTGGKIITGPIAYTGPNVLTGPSLSTGSTVDVGPGVDTGSTVFTGPILDAGPNVLTGPAVDASPTLDTGATIVTAPTIDASPTLDTGATVLTGPFLDAGPTVLTGPTVDASPTVDTGTTVLTGPVLDAGPTILTGPTVDASPTVDTGATVLTGPVLDAGPAVLTGPTIDASPTLDTGATIVTAPTVDASPTVDTGTSIQTDPTFQVNLAGTTGANGPTGSTGADRFIDFDESLVLSEYAYIFNSNVQTIGVEADINFSNNGVITNGIIHTPCTNLISLANTGIYLINYYVIGNETNQFALYQNANQVLVSTYVSAADIQLGIGIVTASAGDFLTIKNHSSEVAVTLQTLSHRTPTNAAIFIHKIK